MGMIYKRRHKDKAGNTKQGRTWWIKYYKDGKPYRESTRTIKESDAKRLLKRREGEIAEGRLPGIYFDRVRFDELAEDFLMDKEINGKSLVDGNNRLSHLRPAFGGMRVTAITTPKINTYIKKRQEEGAANATINRELAALRRMLNMGARQTPPKVDRVLYMPELAENNVRKGFFEFAGFMALRNALPLYLKGFVSFAYETGMRSSEITGLTWGHVDLDRGTVRLEPGETKNDEARTIYLGTELKEIFLGQWTAQKKTARVCPYVFPNETGTSKITDFRRAWSTACREIGLGYGYRINKKYVKKWQDKLPAGPMLHDFRRTAVRDMDRAGIPRSVAMKRSGHKTESVYNRYNIVSDADLQLAAQKIEAYHKHVAGTVLGTRGKVAQLTDRNHSESTSDSLESASFEEMEAIVRSRNH